MDKLKKLRTVHRTAFTKTLTTLNNELDKPDPDKATSQAKLAVLEYRMKELDLVDKQIFSALLDTDTTTPEMLDAEMEGADEYRAKYENAKVKLSHRYEQQHLAAALGALPPANNAAPAIVNNSRKFKLPKMEIRKFDGDPKNWLGFWSSFKKVHDDKDITPEEKFDYLVQSMVESSRASEYVNSFPPTAANYAKVIKGMQNRFGRNDLLVEVYMRELLKIVLNKANWSLTNVYDKLETQIRSLESLGIAADTCAAMLFPLVESALPEEILRAWQRKADAGTEAQQRLNSLMTFLEGEVQNEERIQLAKNGFGTTTPSPETLTPAVGKTEQRGKANPSKAKNNVATAAGLLAAKQTNASTPAVCIFCQEAHESAGCEKAKQMLLEQRQAIAREKRVCFSCLKPGHSAQWCRNKNKCAWCNGRHVLLMCKKISQSNAPDGKASESEERIENLTAVCSNASNTSDVCLQTLRVRLRSPSGEYIVLRALIDPGSHKSYVLRSVAEKMNLKVVGQQSMVHLLFGGLKTTPRDHKMYELHISSLNGDYECCINAFNEETICQALPIVSLGSWMQQLQDDNIWLSDAGGNMPISLLIGADIAGRLYTGKIIQLRKGPTALQTKLGWTLMGKSGGTVVHHEDTAMTVFSMFVRDAKLSDLWELDVLGIEDPIATLSKEAQLQEVKQRFQETVKVNAEGRYEVYLPWKDNHPPLNDNRWAAEKRLRNLTKKLIDEDLYDDYERVFDDWLDQGIIERVAHSDENNARYFLPHRHVLKPGSTTPIRPVFDASAKSGEGPSLNQCLDTGPNLIELVPNILLRFLRHEIGMTADITKAFLQISVAPDQRSVLNFLWWSKSRPGEIIVYRHCRVIFGVNSSPFLLSATIEHHLQKAMKSAESAAEIKILKKLLKSFYVDNSVTSVRSMAEKESFQRTAVAVMQQAGFDLRGWEFTGADDGKDVSILGIRWNTKQDMLSINLNFPDELSDPVTKRKILSAAHRIFDPLGWVCPVSLRPKLMLQDLWNQKIDWDTEVSATMATEFKTWYKQASVLRDVKVPRWIFGEDSDKISLHTFVDASKQAYAAAIFVRVEKSREVTVHLVQAKSRVGPKRSVDSPKECSIPRMELLAATLGARLTNSVKSAMDFAEVETTFWSDSSTVLSWLKEEKQWSKFVWNRVQEIKKLTNIDSWRHVPGTQNPADLPSRGCTASQLIHSRWWEGPEWLKRPSSEWPSKALNVDDSEVNAELCKSARKTRASNALETTTCTRVTTEAQSEHWYLFNTNNYNKILRIMAWILRFANNAKRLTIVKYTQKMINSEEFNSAENFVIKLAQKDSFQDTKDQRLKGLNVLSDEFGVIRARTLISNRVDSEAFRFPAVLSADHELTKILIQHTHERLKHAGVSATMSALRETVWIISSRRAVNSVIGRCVICRRHAAKTTEVPPTSLPANRVRDASVFEVVGIDYAGPLFLKDGKKAWVCLFTCAVYRAVHLELVTSLSTDAFIEVVRRFIARRGRPKIIYSDNGTNFVGAYNMLKTVDWHIIKSYCSADRIQWIFNPPSAAWWGGWWERLIRILKDLLRRSLGRAYLEYQEMYTVLCECEAVINARPLTRLSEEKDNSVAITPEMFLKEIREDCAPDFDNLNSISLTRRVKYLQRLREELKNRFRVEYLGQLTRYQNKRKGYSRVKEGDVVLIASENKKRLDWPLALVLQLIPGNDGTPRIARLKTASGELIRPLQRLIVLENAAVDRDREVNDLEDTGPTSEDVVPEAVKESTSQQDTQDVPEENTKVDKSDEEKLVVNSEKRTRSGRIIKTPKRLCE